MIKIYLTEEQISLLNDDSKKNEEVTFYEFVVNVKQFLKDLLKKPSTAEPSSLLLKLTKSKDELVRKMKGIGLIKSSERIDEVPVEEDKHPYGKKMVAKRYITYTIPKARFSEKMKELYNDVVNNKENLVNEDGEGATTCGSVMQGGGTNPSAGQYDVPFKSLQRKKFWYSSLKRNGDEKNKSISINRE